MPVSRYDYDQSVNIIAVFTFATSAGPISEFIFLIAVSTPFPRNLLGSLSLSSRASYIPVLAPDGTAALKTPGKQWKKVLVRITRMKMCLHSHHKNSFLLSRVPELITN